MRNEERFALLGAVLGLGAPAGALVWRFVATYHTGLWAWFQSEWASVGGFYLYMTLGTVTAFALFGFFLGRNNDVLKDENEKAQGTVSTLNLLAITDGLTGVYNHRHIQEMLAQEVERVERYKTPLSCLMLDIDNFKTVNDTHGHPFGDHVLAQIAQIIRDQVRRIDIVGRYGGEEFMVLMPHAEADVAEVIGERIRKAVESTLFTFQQMSAKVTLSIGLATYPDTAAGIFDKDSFLNASDQALYNAKAAGKNKTIVFKSSVSAPPLKPAPKNS